ncbi:MAG: DUF1146 family protein [Liquorilactobacillus ghanensis]|jgi:uncharacterized integral membrane protein (TIGR02327 family)|uniref:DUF1146 domain-containing protein n=1 Tax=Liquorilactobacillus ghanensis DSM 18630 TaxID=1423750 RepID=A0A0R1VKZ3_9LACO|nr:DUF1146 family protein [Liquorilactobacillus ghanensis]KRM04475.1 hypothetical protein FC89_GL002156 [Liquorilactobacillus ghanensis DSM 18630]
MKLYGITALLNLISNFVFIFIVFVSLQSLRLDRYIAPAKQRSFKWLLIFIAVAIGYGCSSFFLDFIDNVRNLSYLV